MPAQGTGTYRLCETRETVTDYSCTYCAVDKEGAEENKGLNPSTSVG